MFNALLQLLRRCEKKEKNDNNGILNNIFIYTKIITEILIKYCKKLKNVYIENKKWFRIYKFFKKKKFKKYLKKLLPFFI